MTAIEAEGLIKGGPGRRRIEQNKNTFDRARPDAYQSRCFSSQRIPVGMALRPIIILPDPKLRLASRKVEQVDDSLRRLIDDLIETMHEAPGVGLAAIQVGEPIRLLVVDVAKKDDPPDPQAFINPEIVWSSEERSIYEEGCLSIPEYYAEVERPASVRARGLDREGKMREVLAEGLMATVLQHEIDHLDGVLFIDHISKLKRDRVIKKFVKAAKRAADGQHVL
jgi:peptide deformylase